MVSNEAWMGSGTSITMAYESELFLGYMNPGPTMGLTGTKETNLIRFGVGFEVDATAVTSASKTFADYYELVPDLYTGCTASFYWTESTAAPILRMTSLVAGNDKTGLFFSGNLLDFPTSLFNTGTASSTEPRGYIILEGRGAVIPAPLSMETIKTDAAVAIAITADDLDEAVAVNTNRLTVGDRVYNESSALVGQVVTNSGTLITLSKDTTKVASTGVAAALGKQTLTTTSLSGLVQAGDVITLKVGSNYHYAGILLSMNTAGTSIAITNTTTYKVVGDATTEVGPTLTFADTSNLTVGMVVTGTGINSSATTISSIDSATEVTLSLASTAAATVSITCIMPTTTKVYQGALALATSTDILVPYKRTLSDNWVGLTNTITPSNVDVETKQINLALSGSRNWTYQYKGMETASEASIDVNLNHGSWLYYALGNMSAPSFDKTDKTHTSPFVSLDGEQSDEHTVYGGFTAVGRDTSDVGAVANGKFHRVLKGTSALCPPLMPGAGAALLTKPSVNTSGIGQNLITYTFSERNDNILPTFALELTQEKGSNLQSIPMVDRNTYNETVYSQIYPGCMVNSMTISANENEEIKSTLSLNVKRVFETPDGYVSKGYDAINNITSEPKRLFNFGQLTGDDADVTEQNHSLVEPFYFSDGTISLFGTDFMRVSSMSLTINNSITDKRYIGQYSKQIKMAVPAQRTYELTMNAQVTDRRLFDELRRQSPHRFALAAAETDSTKHALIQLLFTKNNGERIKLQFDDYMITTNSWPVPDDKGVIAVDFTIMPLKIGVVDAVSAWVMQK